MPDTTLHIRIKKEYAATLIKVRAVEAVEEEAIELTAQQKEELDKELAAIAANRAYLQKWDGIQNRFKNL